MKLITALAVSIILGYLASATGLADPKKQTDPVLAALTPGPVYDHDVIKVLIVDSGVVPNKYIKPYLPPKLDQPEKSQKNYVANYFDHGTHVAGIVLYGDLDKSISPVCRNVQIESCSIFNIEDKVIATVNCLRHALNSGANFVNMSMGGENADSSEKMLIKLLSDRGTIIIAAAGNEGRDLNVHNFYPAKYRIEDPTIKNLIPVTAMNYAGDRLSASNFGGGIVFDYGYSIKSLRGQDETEYMSGSSQATAMYTHRLLLSECLKIRQRSSFLRKNLKNQ